MVSSSKKTRIGAEQSIPSTPGQDESNKYDDPEQRRREEYLESLEMGFHEECIRLLNQFPLIPSDQREKIIRNITRLTIAQLKRILLMLKEAEKTQQGL